MIKPAVAPRTYRPIPAKPIVAKASCPPHSGQDTVCFSGLNRLPGKKSLLAMTFLALFGVFGASRTSNANSIPLNPVFPTDSTCSTEPSLTSDASLIRREIHQKMGLTGRGTTIVFLDADHDHLKATSAFVTDSCRGIAPNATLKSLLEEGGTYDEAANKSFQFQVGDNLNGFSDWLEKLLRMKLDSGDKTPWVVNVSASQSQTWESSYVQQEVKRRAPDALKAVYGTTDPSVLENRSEADIKRDVHDFINTQYEGHKDAFDSALKRYQEVTKRLADSGVFLVVSAGNHHHSTDVIQDPGDETSHFSMSDSVLTAAASNMNSTPENRQDDTIAPFSSRGDGRFNPTTATPGDRISLIYSGTSYSAPQLSGYIALMLEKNPNLTFNQVKDLIAKASVDTAAPPEAEGAGILDPVKLLQITPTSENTQG